ncbi:MAG: PAS domain S-box protein [Desulfosalsimonadaceae bacterium]
MPKKNTYNELQKENKALKKQLAELQENNEKYRYLLENLNEVVYTLDHNAAVTYISPNIEKISGYSQNEILGRPFTDFVHPKDLPSRVENFQKVFYGEDLVTEYRYLTRSGESVWIRTHGRPIMRNGEFAGIQGMLVDISDRKETEAALQRSEKKFRDLFDNSADAIFIHNLDGRMLEVNEVACIQTGYCRQELLEMTPMDIVAPQEVSEVLKRIESSGRNGPLLFETVHRRKDGIEYPVEVKTRKMEFDGIPAILGVARDITERRFRENVLRESEWQKDLILNSSAENIIYFDADLRIIWGNRAVTQTVGKAEEEIIGRYCYELFHQRSTPCPDCLVQRTRDARMPQEAEKKSEDGKYWLQRAYPSAGDAAESNAIIMFSRDITEKKQAQEENARLQEHFQQSRKLESIGRLAGGVAHDLNNLLSPILGYGEMLQAAEDEDESRKNKLRQIVEAGKRARAMVRQLLAFSRKQMLEFTTIDLNELLKNFKELLHSILSENIAVKFRPAEALPLVKGDAGQLEQVIMNLAVNAKDAMPYGGELIIETAAVELDEKYAKRRNGVTPGGYVMLAISDTGYGMDGEIKDQIFDPFFTTKGTDKATGMGLSTVYGIVKQHGGNIWAYSEPGLGTTFKVYLPVSDELSMPPADAVAPEKRKRKETKPSETILVVEDEEVVRDLVVSMLEKRGYRVLVGKSAGEAVSISNHHKGAIDLLLTDVVLPDMNGKNLYQQISGQYPWVPVLFMSGYTEEVIAYHGVLEAGVNFIQKPFSLGDLTSKIDGILNL